jgi:hypothetical protein
VTFTDASVPAISATITSGSGFMCNSYKTSIEDPTIASTRLASAIVKELNNQTSTLRCLSCDANCSQSIACVN